MMDRYMFRVGKRYVVSEPATNVGLARNQIGNREKVEALFRVNPNLELTQMWLPKLTAKGGPV